MRHLCTVYAEINRICSCRLSIAVIRNRTVRFLFKNSLFWQYDRKVAICVFVLIMDAE